MHAVDTPQQTPVSLLEQPNLQHDVSTCFEVSLQSAVSLIVRHDDVWQSMFAPNTEVSTQISSADQNVYDVPATFFLQDIVVSLPERALQLDLRGAIVPFDVSRIERDNLSQHFESKLTPIHDRISPRHYHHRIHFDAYD